MSAVDLEAGRQRLKARVQAARGDLWPIATQHLARGVPRDVARRSMYGADGAFPDSPAYACALTRPRPSALDALRGWITARLIRPRVWWASRGPAPF